MNKLINEFAKFADAYADAMDIEGKNYVELREALGEGK